MKEKFNLMSFFEGYVRNYRRLNLHESTNRSKFTNREINYFSDLGEMLGYFSFVEDYKPNHDIGRSRPMDLSWWKYDARMDKENYLFAVLHLERENLHRKDIETLDKLFSDTEIDYVPQYVIGIQNVENKERIGILNEIVKERNENQKSHVLMIYRYLDEINEFDRVEAYYFNDKNEVVDHRNAISSIDQTGYWFMTFEEEFKNN